MDQVQLMTQPETGEEMTRSESLEKTLEKLKHLVEENPAPNDEKEGDEHIPKVENEKAKEDLHERHSSEDEGDEDQEYDNEGFAIPPGKIPIDGHFSTREIKELVELAKEEGLIDLNIDVDVLKHSEKLGDQVVLRDHHDSEKTEDS